jgi:hypothetical protein
VLLFLPCTQAVADAELDGNDDMIAITASHAAKYAVQLVRQSTDLACMTSKVGLLGCFVLSRSCCPANSIHSWNALPCQQKLQQGDLLHAEKGMHGVVGNQPTYVGGCGSVLAWGVLMACFPALPLFPAGAPGGG